MAFNSYEFIILFLPVALLGFYLLNRLQNNLYSRIWLLVASFFFYGYASRSYLIAILISLAVNYCLAISIVHLARSKKLSSFKKCLLVLGLIVNIGSLFFYKCTDFLISNINSVFSTDYTLLNLIAPIGISFFTFKQIAFLVDTYKGNGTLKYSVLDYTNYILFFPEILSGPISLHSEFIPQLANANTYRFQSDNFSAGIYQFSCGIAKKVLIADVLAKFVDLCFITREIPNSTMAFMGMLAYTMQIYFDFSGYSDMAVGVAKMFNIEIINNFNSPYQANSVSEFWKRWHISLTRFFTTYIYFPLGGSKKGMLRTILNTIFVFLISGLWHGSNWTFILWGFAYGLLLVFERIFKIRSPQHRWSKIIGRITTLIFVNLLWVFFRADNIGIAITLIREMFAFQFSPLDASAAAVFLTPGLEFILSRINLLSLGIYLPYLFLASILLVTQLAKNTEQNIASRRYQKISYAVFSAVLIVLSILSFDNVSKFIYWNF